jgi:hypothetical protein
MNGKTFFAAFLIVIGLAMIYIVVSGKTNNVISAVKGTTPTKAVTA